MDAAGQHDVDGDAVARDLAGERLRPADDGGTDRVRDAEIGDRLLDAGGGDGDDAPPLSLDHARHDQARRFEQVRRHGGEILLPDLRLDRAYWARRRPTGIIDQDVDRPLFEEGGNGGGQRATVGDVDEHWLDQLSRVLRQHRGAVRPSRARTCKHRSAFLRQGVRHRRTQSAAGAEHKGPPACDAEIHQFNSPLRPSCSRRLACLATSHSISAVSSPLSARPGRRMNADAITPRACRTCLRAARPMPGCCS